MTEILLSASYLQAGAAERHAGNMQLNDKNAVHHVRLPSGKDGWLVTGYDAVREALASPKLHGRTGVVGDRRPLSEDVMLGMNSHMLNAEPPDHTRLRRLISAAFTRRRMEQMRGRIEQITAELLDDMAGQDEVDLVQSLAIPLPIRVLTEMIGVPEADTDAFHGWTTKLTSAAVPLAELDGVATEMLHYTRVLLERKRREPKADLLSALVAVRDGNDRLAEHELTSMVFLLLIAGQETTVNLISNGSLALLSNPEQRAKLTARPAMVATAVEELLRYETPVQAAVRYAPQEITLAGVTIPAGSVVMISLLGANRDPARFVDPDKLDLDRSDSPQLGFGHGIHKCLGAPLARLEGGIAITALFRRYPNLQLAAPAESLRWRMSMVMHGLAELPVRLG